MEFVKASDSTKGIRAITARLKKELSNNKKVLWLVSGGSAIAAEVEILNQLQKNAKIENLAVMLMDERFGLVGHANSNWQQLLEAGADFTGMYALPVMTSENKSYEETLSSYARLIKTALGSADVIIGLFGLGPDAHTAGILPESLATKDTDKLVIGYDAPPLKRITLTRLALRQVDVGYVFAFGNSKAEALNRLKNNTEPFKSLPAKLLWDLPEVHILNDQRGESQ